MLRNRPERPPLLEGEVTGQIIGAFYECYNTLGFGFLETVYRRAITIELRRKALRYAEEVPIEVAYRGVAVGIYRADLIVEDRVVVEIKATSVLGPSDKRQLLNYLRATRIKVGLLLHFGPDKPTFIRCADCAFLDRNV